METAAKYRAVNQGAWRQMFAEAFPAGARILDVGAGSGRDLALLLEMGFDASGTEPVAAMRDEALKAYPQLAGKLFDYGLPLPEEADVSGPFDGMICSAVFQHVPELERFNAALSFKRLLREKGRLWISVPGERLDLDGEHRDPAGRLFQPAHPGTLVPLFEGIGFHLVRQWEEADHLGRPGFTWNSFLFELDSAHCQLLDRVNQAPDRDTKNAA